MNRRLFLALLLAASLTTAALASARPNPPAAAISGPTLLAAVGDAATVSVRQTSTSTPFEFTASQVEFATNAPTTFSPANGYSVGKAKFGPLVLTKPYDASSLELQKFMFTGKSMLRVTIKLTGGGGYVLGGAFVTSVRSNAPAGEAALPTDEVTFIFSKLRLSTPDAASTCWNLATATATCP